LWRCCLSGLQQWHHPTNPDPYTFPLSQEGVFLYFPILLYYL
jgi:hypothetical protein